MMKVKNRMIYRLNIQTPLGMEDVEQAIEAIIIKINTCPYYDKGLVHKEDPTKQTLLPDCWDTDENLYIPEHMEELWSIVYRCSYEWCVAKMESMK